MVLLARHIFGNDLDVVVCNIEDVVDTEDIGVEEEETSEIGMVVVIWDENEDEDESVDDSVDESVDEDGLVDSFGLTFTIMHEKPC